MKHLKKNIFNKWIEGNVGIPLVDACMRELTTTEYINGRCIMLVSSFITNNLIYKWYEAEHIFSRL